MSCAAMLSRSLDDAVELLSKKYGADPAKWRWGVAHQAEFRNPALSQIPLIGSVFNNDIPADGGEDTVNAGYMNIGDAKAPFAGHGGPGLRMILDLSDLTRSRFLMSPGVSGNPFSGHYGDLLVPWRSFDWMVLSRAETVSSLTLLPRR
jgi:penicillin amidase